MKPENDSSTDKQIYDNNLTDHSYDSTAVNSKISSKAILVNPKINFFENSKDDLDKMEREGIKNQSDLDSVKNNEFPNLSEDEKKKLFYKKVDEILNMNNSNDDEWIKSENDESVANSIISEKHEYDKKIKSKDFEPCHAKMKSKKKNYIDKNIFNESFWNFQGNELHKILKKNKYEYTKMNVTMDNAFYKYLYICKKKQQKKIIAKRNQLSQIDEINQSNKVNDSNLITPFGSNKYQTEFSNNVILVDTDNVENSEKNNSWVDGSSESGSLSEEFGSNNEQSESSELELSKDINFLYIEYFIRSKKIIKLRNIYKYIYNKRNMFYLKALVYKNVYILDCTKEINKRYNTFENKNQTINKYCVNNNFLCMAMNSNEVIVFSLRGLELNSRIFCKGNYQDDIKIQEFLSTLIPNEYEQNCMKINFNYYESPYCIITNNIIKNIRNIDINNLNKLCICTDDSIHIYEIVTMENYVIKYKYIHSYNEKKNNLLANNKIWLAYLINDKKFIYFTYFNIIYMNRNSKMFNNNIYTISKDIKFKYRLLNAQMHKNFLFSSYNNKVTVLKDEQLYFVITFDVTGEIVQPDNGKSPNLGKKGEDNANYKQPTLASISLKDKEETHLESDENGSGISDSNYNDNDKKKEETDFKSEKNKINFIPFVSILEWENYFCTGYVNKLIIFEYTSSKIQIKKKFILKHNIYYLNYSVNNILIIYDKTYIYIYQIIIKDMELSLFQIFCKTYDKIQSYTILENDNIYESFSSSIKCSVKNIKINRNDKIARFVFPLFNGPNNNSENNYDGKKGTDDYTHSSKIGSNINNFYINLVYLYIHNNNKVDIIVLNSLIYLIYLFFYYKKYDALLILILYTYNGDISALADLPLREEDRKNKIKKLLFLFFEMNMKGIIEGNYGSSITLDMYKDKHIQSNDPNYESNNIFEGYQNDGSSGSLTYEFDSDSKSASNKCSDKEDNFEKIKENESIDSGYISSEKIYIKNEVVDKIYVEELLKLCKLAIELSIKFNINLYEYIFNLFKVYNIENIYFYLCEYYIINKQICFTHHSLIENLIEHFRKFYKICSFYNDICYDLFLFFCNYVSEKWIEKDQNLNSNRYDDKVTKWKYINKYIYFLKLKKKNYKHIIRQSSDQIGEEKNVALYEDFEKYFCYKYLNIWKGLRHIKKIYSFICLINKFCKIFENINLENVIENIISLLPVHISSFLYSRHNDDKITNCEFFLSYIIRKKNNFFYNFCKDNNVNNSDFPIYIPSYIYINFYQTYFLFDYVYSVIFKLPFSLSINRYEIKNNEIDFWMCLKSEEEKNIYTNFDMNNVENYFSIFFIYSKFFLSYKNSYFHSIINQNVIFFINHLCRRHTDFKGTIFTSQTNFKENKFMDSFLWQPYSLLVNQSINKDMVDKHSNNTNLISNIDKENILYKNNCNVNLNYFFNLDKNGIFILFQLSLSDCFYIINNMFYYYNMSKEENLINNFVHNICDFYIHLISTLIYYTNNLKAILKKTFDSEICEDFVKNIFYGISQSKGGFFKIKLFVLKFFHYICSEKNYIINMNIQNVVTWIVLQIYFITKEIDKLVDCLTYMLILFFIFAKDEIFFEYKLNIYFINFLFQHCFSLNHVQYQNKLRAHRRMYKKMCIQQFCYYNGKNEKNPFMRHVSFFSVKKKNMLVKKNKIIKDNHVDLGRDTYSCDLVQYIIFRIYNLDLVNLFGDTTLELNRRRKEANTHMASCDTESDENKSKTTRRDDSFSFEDKRETIFKNQDSEVNNFFLTNNENKRRLRKKQKKKTSHSENIFNMNNYKKNLKYILLLYVKKLIFIQDEENRKTSKSSLKDYQKQNKKRDINNLLKYIAFFSYIKKKKYMNIYLAILDYFYYYNPILEYYKNQNNLTKLYEYVYYKIYYFYNEKCVKTKLYGYIFYRDLFKHIHIFKDTFSHYILNSYFYFNKKVIMLLQKKMKKKFEQIETVKKMNIILSNSKSDSISRIDEGKGKNGLSNEYENNDKTIEKETYQRYESSNKKNSDNVIGRNIIELWKIFVKKLIYCNNFSDQLRQQTYFLLIYKCNMPYAIKKYVHKKIFSKYINLLCMYNKEKVYKFVKYIQAEHYQSIFIKYKIINVILYIYENSGDFIKITNLCLKEIKHKILKLFSIFNIKNKYEFSKNVNYDDIYAINFSKKVDIYNFYSMPFKKNVLKKLGIKKKENTHTGLRGKDIFLNNLFKEINYEHGQNFFYYYYVGKKHPHKVQKLHDEKQKRNDITDVDRDNNKYFGNTPGDIKRKPQTISTDSSDNDDGAEIKKKEHSENIYMKHLLNTKKNKNIVDLMKCYWIYNTEEYNLIFLYIYMLTFILKRNKYKNNKLNEYVIFHIINECLKNIIEISEQVIKKEQNKNKMDFFSYLFEQILLFVININSHVHTQKICKKLLHKYKNHQIKLIKLPLIAILKKMIDEHTFFNDNCQIAENKIKEQIKTYTNGKKKGLIINFKPEHTHKFNTDLYYISSATGKHKNSDYENSQNTYFSTNGIVYINKCEHGYHFSCSQKCYLCDDFKK
ncbi:conserved Plasmodium protein, unknown function [Plasmodium vinckei vinckei]|uniref:Uncharacterized protein n=1 Tax=Plasmodium vinckei vinckei TaxID=54757 RepID=A0A081ID25_PLAVN|nr:conserved Plasmodium protein, unknown function [Plasmodium vinckei vinckei]KEG01583.1 hypothetical protein YYE_03681 [Plasmodium vinckei vinckei]VEV55564.1 conserved Plasmodium protein, unknown function [Plasmodium vinckei vinckei]